MFEILLVSALIIVAIVLLVTERYSFDTVALIIMSVLLVSGILTVEEALSGFSNQATITIAAMFVLSDSIRRTGALNSVGDKLSKLGKQNYWLALIVIMIVTSVCSAFINNTAAVAIFIPIMIEVAADIGVSPSKLLMPVSFAAMLGGSCTLIGTSTNLLVNSIAQKYGEPSFSMFEFTLLGIIFLFFGLIYLSSIGIRLIPPRRTQKGLVADFELNRFLTDVIVEEGCEQIGKRVGESSFIEELDLEVIQIFRESNEPLPETQEVILKSGDILRIRGRLREIKKLLEQEELSLRPRKNWYDIDFESETTTLVEAIVAPDSHLESRKVSEINFHEEFGIALLAFRRGKELQRRELGEVRLTGGDSLLLSVDREHLPELKQNRAFVLVSEVGLSYYRKEKMPIAIAILIGVVSAAAFGIIPIVASAMTGCVLLILTGCLTSKEVYEAISWEVILLLGGVLSLGLAMQKTGVAELISKLLISILGNWGPAALLSGFFLLSMLLTNIMSNQATAALIAPIVIQTANSLQVSPRPFLFAVSYAASMSFLTPVGYQTNAMVYGPGQYKFTDFTKVGALLNIVLWIIATFAIPMIWHF